MTSFQARELACAITWQAVKDFCSKKATAEHKCTILKDLRSPYMNMLTDGTSVVVAEQLEKNPNEIRARVLKLEEEEEKL